MIQKAIEKIDEEIKSGGMYERTLGEYVKSELLTSDSNALKILAPNTDLETFMERLWEAASALNSTKSAKNKKGSSELGKEIIAIIRGIKDDKVSEESSVISQIGEKCDEAVQKSVNQGICLSSKIVIPLLHIYYGIPLETSGEKESAPKRRRFNTVSLD